MNDLDAISRSLGAATAVAAIPRPTPEVKEVEVDNALVPEIEDDYNEARSNLKELISQAMEMVPELVDLTKQAQSDKMYTAASTFIKTAADLNISLSKLSKEIKQPPKNRNIPGNVPEQNTPSITQHNTIFLGSTEEFLDMMEERSKVSKQNEQAIEGDYVEIKT